MPEPNLLETGIFIIPEAAGLVGASQSMVRIWVDGHQGKQEPIIENELGRVDGKLAISFTNLMELQFVAFFARASVPLREIRAIMHEVKRALKHPHPFATRTVFMTDGRKVVAMIARNNGIAVRLPKTSNPANMVIAALHSSFANHPRKLPPFRRRAATSYTRCITGRGP
jgi:hypothetical protein